MFHLVSPSPARQTPQSLSVAVVVPCFNVERHIEEVVRRMPAFVRWIVLVDDASTDRTFDLIHKLARADARIVVAQNPKNLGVGGAMVTGFRQALSLPADVVVKVDGDGQMAPEDIPWLLRPIANGRADYAKGNRFWDLVAIRKMPLLRRLGNLALSFMTKVACGYWRTFDPTNGFIAIRKEVLRGIDLSKVDPSYFFEISMLHHLYLVNAVVRDVALPARYGDETSHLRIGRLLRQFPPRLCRITVQRLLWKKLTHDFTVEGLYFVVGSLFLLFAAIFGGSKWIYYASLGVGAPSGTIALPGVSLVLGVQLYVAAISHDIQAEPVEPIWERLHDDEATRTGVDANAA